MGRTRKLVNRAASRHDEEVLGGWYRAHLESKKQDALPVRSQEVWNFLGNLWPASIDYNSPLNPVLLTECLSPAQMNTRAVWLVRDGLVPMLWFFRVNPNPAGFRGKLLIHRRNVGFVPQAWRRHVGAYEFETIPSAQVRKRSKLLLSSIVMNSYCSLPALEGFLTGLVKQLGKKNLAKRQLFAFLLPRFDGFGMEHRHDFCGQFMGKVFEALGTKIHFLQWRYLDALESYEDFEVADLNEQFLYADSYQVHLPLSRGAGLLRLDQDGGRDAAFSKASGRFVALSPHHGFRVWDEVPSAAFREPISAAGGAKDSLSARFQAAMRSDANTRFPWPTWFTEWVGRSSFRR